MTIPTAAQLLQGNAKAFKFEAFGDTAEGTIVGIPQVKQVTKIDGTPDFFPSGDPKYQILATLQTTMREDQDDDGLRTLYIKSYLMQAVRLAVQQAGAPELEDGGYLKVIYTSDGEAKRGQSAPKIFQAEYRRPNATGSVLGVQPQAPQTYAQQVAGMQSQSGTYNAPVAGYQPPLQQQAPPPPGYGPPAQVVSQSKQHSPEVKAALEAAGIDPASVPVQG